MNTRSTFSICVSPLLMAAMVMTFVVTEARERLAVLALDMRGQNAPPELVTEVATGAVTELEAEAEQITEADGEDSVPTDGEARAEAETERIEAAVHVGGIETNHDMPVELERQLEDRNHPRVEVVPVEAGDIVFDAVGRPGTERNPTVERAPHAEAGAAFFFIGVILGRALAHRFILAVLS